MNVPAIILAGGLGTRLQSVVSDLPKPMAPVNGKPFLHYVLEDLQEQGITEAILSVGHKFESIVTFFGNHYCGISLRYVIERKPLGTGGGMMQAMAEVEGPCFILNGDTLFKVNLREMKHFAHDKNADLTLALKRMEKFDRYGTVTLAEHKRILSFEEKRYCDSGLINGGVYYAQADIFSGRHLPEVFSFEKEILEKEAGGSLYGFESNGYFIDIGIPEDFARAQKELKTS